MTKRVFHGRAARLMFLVVAALVFLFSPGTQPAALASHITCGATLGAGNYVLDSDLACDPGPGGAILTLSTGARVNLNNKGLRCTHTVVVFDHPRHGIRIAGTNALVIGGHINKCDIGVLLSGGGHHDLSGLRVEEASAQFAGIQLVGSHNNHIHNSTSSSPNQGTVGVSLEQSNGNMINAMVVARNERGFMVFDSHTNVITANDISGNRDRGMQVEHSTHNSIRNNVINDNPVFGIVLVGESDENTILSNTVNATIHGTTLDGINIGCKECPFGPPSGTADHNLIQSNTSNNHSRYGIAQAPGQIGNVYKNNTATGNGVANFAIDP